MNNGWASFFAAVSRMRWSVILLTYGLLATMILLYWMGFKEAAIFVAAVTGVVGVIGIIAAPDTPAQMPASTGEKMLELMFRLVDMFKSRCTCGAGAQVLNSYESTIENSAVTPVEVQQAAGMEPPAE